MLQDGIAAKPAGDRTTRTYRDVDRWSAVDRAWVADAIQKVEADANRSADTHLHVFPLPLNWGIHLYLKDESVHPTGSLKHRLARSLFLFALCNGWIHSDTTVVEASSGSTAVSEAYFARLLGLEFVAVLPTGTSHEKVDLIRTYGGTCRFVDEPATILDESRRVAAECGGHFMDQFTYAERATDWRGNNNIAESIYDQMTLEPFAVPSWIVVSAGTGGTSATIGRYIRYRRLDTKLCVVDPERSAFFPGWANHDPEAHGGSSRIEGIGRPRVELSFVPGVVDRMMEVPDAASIASMRFLLKSTGRRAGGSTGTNLWGALRLVAEMHQSGERGSVVTLMCDGGERYADTYYDDEWVAREGLRLEPYSRLLDLFVATGAWLDPPPVLGD